jgi:superfamily I DNA and/or RNA helicase
VTPYNAQVVTLRHKLDAAGLTDVAVGTVDKFQGRQAPVVFVSMTASSIDDVPRGISFLLNRNRLNVAVSRAKYLSVIVRSETLTEYLPGTPDGLVELGAFLSLAPCDTPTR